jgi:hypothetical protein
LNIVFSTGSAGSFTLGTSDQYTFVDTGDGTTIDGSAGGGDTLFGGADMTYVEAAGAGNNRIVFTAGTNTFDGDTTGGGGAGDTIVAGTGVDTINTGVGPTTVFAGGFDTQVTLNDTVSGDVVVLQSGFTDVSAANMAGVTDTISGGAGEGNIFAGAGTLVFVAEAGVTAPGYEYIEGSSGTVEAFGNSNSYISLAGTGLQVFQAGAGNETLDGSGSSGFAFFGDTNAGDSVADTVYGGNSDYFSTGVGSEYFSAGAGDIFNIASVSGATSITIDNFTSSDSVSFDSPTVTATTDGTNYTVTLQDGTTVEFLGITSLPTHTT